MAILARAAPSPRVTGMDDKLSGALHTLRSEVQRKADSPDATIGMTSEDCRLILAHLDAQAAALASLQVRCNEGFAAHAASFGALVDVAMQVNMDDVDDYAEVAKAVRRLARRTVDAESALAELREIANRAARLRPAADMPLTGLPAIREIMESLQSVASRLPPGTPTPPTP